VRSRVQSSWRTRLLLFIAFVAAGLIAYHRVQEREPEPPPGPTSEASRDVVEVEIVAE